MIRQAFHPSELSMGSHFRESFRGHKSFTTQRMDRVQSMLSSALEKHSLEHPGEDTLTAKNFDKVMAHVRKDPGYHRLYSAGPGLEHALRAHLGIKEPPTAQ